MKVLTKSIKELLDEIMKWANGHETDFLEVKKILGSHLSTVEKRNLSKVHPHTRKQVPNEYEFEIMRYWKEKTGQDLIVPPHKLHPSDWVYRPRGWNLEIVNEERKKQYALAKKENK